MDTSIPKAQLSVMNDRIRLTKEQIEQPPASERLRAEVKEEALNEGGHKSIAEREQERKERQEDRVTLSEEALKRLRGEEVKKTEEEEDSLPPHVSALKKQAEKLKEKLDEKLETFEELQRQPNVSPEVLEMHMKELQMMQAQLSQLKESLAEAMKEAGIVDPSVLADL